MSGVILGQSWPVWTILGHFEPFRAILSHSKPCWDIPRQSEPDRAIQRSSSSPRPWRTSRKINQTRALGRREAPSAPKGPEGPLGPWGALWTPPWALGWGVGGGAIRKHVPAGSTNELKHVPAKLGESNLGSTATTRRVKQSPPTLEAQSPNPSTLRSRFF